MNIPSLFCAVALILVPASSGEDSFSATIKKLLGESGEASFTTGWIPLGLKAADKQEKQVAPGHITEVGEAQMQFHFPAGWKPQDKRPALCIFPGGGYTLLAIEKEGTRIAQWAAERGMVGIAVKYRVSQENDAIGKFPGPLLDARQAVRMTRKHAGELGVNPRKIGVMGFSAGGHLAAMTATLWDKTLPEEEGNPLNSVSARPDFSMLIYPVITMTPKAVHHGSRNKIIGPKPDPAMEQLCSPEQQVAPHTPPVFLVHAQDDGVSCANSQLMEKACRDNGVPVTLRLYSRGGHGYGMEKRGNPTDAWPLAAEQWLAERGLLSSPLSQKCSQPDSTAETREHENSVL